MDPDVQLIYRAVPVLTTHRLSQLHLTAVSHLHHCDQMTHTPSIELEASDEEVTLNEDSSVQDG